MSTMSFDLHAGEVLGLVALEGQGQDELFGILSGALRPDAGTLEVVREALERAVERDPDCANVWAALSQLHNDSFRFGFNVTDERSSYLEAAIEAGAEDYLPKPFDPVLLRARIRAGLARARLPGPGRGDLRTHSLRCQRRAGLEAPGMVATPVSGRNSRPGKLPAAALRAPVGARRHLPGFRRRRAELVVRYQVRLIQHRGRGCK